jgi:hypothetical protein
MNLYEVYNGYTGNGAVFCVVIAENENQAKELASEVFKEQARPSALWTEVTGDEFNYPERFWTNLEVELKHEDTSKPFAYSAGD